MTFTIVFKASSTGEQSWQSQRPVVYYEYGHAMRREVKKEVRGHNLARGDNSVVRLAAISPLSLFTLLLSSTELVHVVHGAI